MTKNASDEPFAKMQCSWWCLSPWHFFGKGIFTVHVSENREGKKERMGKKFLLRNQRQVACFQAKAGTFLVKHIRQFTSLKRKWGSGEQKTQYAEKDHGLAKKNAQKILFPAGIGKLTSLLFLPTPFFISWILLSRGYRSFFRGVSDPAP